jgi:hypothetical protein
VFVREGGVDRGAIGSRIKGKGVRRQNIRGAKGSKDQRGREPKSEQRELTITKIGKSERTPEKIGIRGTPYAPFLPVLLCSALSLLLSKQRREERWCGPGGEEEGRG